MQNIAKAIDIFNDLSRTINKENDSREEVTQEQRARRTYPLELLELKSSQVDIIKYIIATTKKLAPKEKTKKKKQKSLHVGDYKHFSKIKSLQR